MATFVVELLRLADGTVAGSVTALATGRTERFHGWQALLALLADDPPPCNSSQPGDEQPAAESDLGQEDPRGVADPAAPVVRHDRTRVVGSGATGAVRSVPEP